MMLKLGDQVVRELDGMEGVVLQAGPYGDQPFQIKDSMDRYHGGIWEDGTCALNNHTWRKLEKDAG